MTEILDRVQICLNGHKFTVREAKLEGTGKHPTLRCPADGCHSEQFTELHWYPARNSTEGETV